MTARLHLAPGATVRVDDLNYDVVGLNREVFGEVICRDLGSQELLSLPASQLEFPRVTTPRQLDLAICSEESISRANFRLEVVESILDGPTTIADMDAVAAKYGVSRTSVYRWRKRYRDGAGLSALVDGDNAGTTGKCFVDERTERVISQTIFDDFLTKQRNSEQCVADTVVRRCVAEGIPPPNHKTVRLRIHRLDPIMVAQLRGERKTMRDVKTARPGTYSEADAPLAVVQIDHAVLDIAVVDEHTREVITRRPWITVAIDVYSRMICGISLDHKFNGLAAVAECLSRSICRKEGYLRALGVEAEWPIWGFPRTVHSDNAKEFRATALARACNEYGIILARRPVKTPRYGAHIERYMGRLATEMKALPGATFSNVRERGEYDSQAEARISLRALEQLLVRWITGVYHKTSHSGVGVSPLQRLQEGVFGENGAAPAGLPDIAADERRVRLDFMPAQPRAIGRSGVQWDYLHYYDKILDPFIAERVKYRRAKQYLFRRDPQDVTKIYFRHPDTGEYHAIPSSNLTLPEMSLAEYKHHLAVFKARAEPIDELAISQAIEANRALVAAETTLTLETRRHGARKGRAAQAQRLRDRAAKLATQPDPPEEATEETSYSARSRRRPLPLMA